MNRPMFYPAVEVSAQQITAWLESGASVVLPTETVYGLAAKAGNPQSADRLCRLKGRPADMNLPVVIGGIHQLSALGVDFNRTAQVLAKVFWPGPLTLVLGFSASGARPAWLSGRIEVAVRLPDHDLLREIAVRAGPILLTSANGHGTGPKTDAHDAVKSLHASPDYVVDAGRLSQIPSTIVNVRVSPALIERTGAISVADVQRLIDSCTLPE